MKTSLKKLRGALRNERKDHRRPHHKTRTHLGELDQATQDMKDMRGCYDRLLSAAAATANSVYEFSESLGEMGVCLLEKTALSDDEETGKVLLMLGKVQLELQKLVDGYRSHIFQTITVPSESLLNELRIVEEMKRCCDEKRETYDLLRKSREKGKLRGSKGECFSSHQLHEARNEYDEETNAFVFRMKSLRQGQSRNLLTQAARHHAAQLTFFRKALKSLEAIEPHVKLVALEQHIDYNFSELEDDDDDDTEDDDDDGDNYEDADAFESEDESELSFDCGPNAQRPEVRASRTLMEVDNTDVTFPQAVTTGAAKETLERIPSTKLFAFSKGLRGISRSGPISLEKRFDPAERLAQMRQSPSQKFSSYVLPTPQETKALIPAKADDDVPQARRSSPSNTTSNLWHSSPLQRNKYEKIVSNFSGHIMVNTQSVLKESNDNTRSSRLPPPVTEGLSPPRKDPRSTSEYKKPKRQAFSGPLTGKPWPHKSLSSSGPIASSGYSQQSSGPLLHNTMPRPASAPKLSSRVSPTFVSSPKISELHELPRPPSHLGGPSHRIAHSGPLVSNLAATSKTITPTEISALPVPFKNVPRSYSIPTTSQIEETSHASKPLETPDSSRMAEDSSSPAS